MQFSSAVPCVLLAFWAIIATASAHYAHALRSEPVATTTTTQNQNGTNSTQLIFSVYARRNPNLTESEFHEHWSKVHGPLCASWLPKFGITKYVQYHTPEAYRAEAGALGLPTVIEYDGIALFWMDSLDSLRSALVDPYYADVVHPDEIYLFDQSVGGEAVTSGYSETFIKDGRSIVKK